MRFLVCVLLSVVASSCCYVHRNSSECVCVVVDWRYGASEMRIQTGRAAGDLMDRWFAKTGHDSDQKCPHIFVSKFNNLTDCFIPEEIVRDALEKAALDDGRFSIAVGKRRGKPTLLAKVSLSRDVFSGSLGDVEVYQLTIGLYDAESDTLLDSAKDVLCKSAF